MSPAVSGHCCLRWSRECPEDWGEEGAGQVRGRLLRSLCAWKSPLWMSLLPPSLQVPDGGDGEVQGGPSGEGGGAVRVVHGGVRHLLPEQQAEARGSPGSTPRLRPGLTERRGRGTQAADPVLLPPTHILQGGEMVILASCTPCHCTSTHIL